MRILSSALNLIRIRSKIERVTHRFQVVKLDQNQRKKMSTSQSPSHNVFVYGSIQEPAVAAVILDRTADTVPAVLHGYHRYKLKGRPYPCIVPLESGKVNGKVITGVSDAELNNFDVIEGNHYDRVTVEVVRMDNSEKMKAETYVWKNKNDPRMYGEWDFEEWRVVHGEKFVETFKKILEWNKNPNGKRLEDVVGPGFSAED